MKLSHLVLSAALAAALATGCARRPKNITPLPATDRVGGTVATLGSKDPIGGGTLDGAGNPRSTTPGNPFRGGPGASGTEIPTGSGPATTNLNPIPENKDQSNAGQPDRTKWETWPQDPDTLRGNIVYFDFDKSLVKRSESAKVAAIAEYLKGHPGYMLKLDGHADERGTEDYNRALGERRALSVRETLLNLGISADSVVTTTFGEDRPADRGHNEAAWAKNRRVEPVVLIPPGSTR